MKDNQNSFYLLIFIIILLGYLSYNNPSTSKFENTKINTVLKQISRNYVDSVDYNSLIENTIKETLKNLDPHSVYMNVEEVQNSREMMQGSFDGIGIEFSIHRDTIVIINVIPNGPSDKKGLQAGERIISIENENVAGVGITNQDVIKKLRGRKGTKVNIGINTKKDTLIRSINLIRGKIPLVSLDVAYAIRPNIGYIKLNRFSATTFKEFKLELEKLKREKNIESLILDLRGNSGGYLDQSIKILNEFFGNGELLVYTEGNARKKQEYFADSFGIFKSGKLCVLIDEGSASASEIVAGAIQDNDRGIIIGERSFGKGLVQEQISLNDGSLIRLTVSRYYTPSGRCIQKAYSEDQEEYFSEMYIRDVNETIDTLEKFTTIGGKIVYGGGGIMPDNIVQSTSDSLPASLVYLYTSDFFSELAYDYANLYRNNDYDFKNFTIDNRHKKNILLKIEKWLSYELVENINEKQLIQEIEKNQKNIINRISTLIIRQVYGWSEMQIFLNQNDEVITTSLSLLQNKL
ncbi:MAG: peptidase S41 [Flavobacteriales bacterium]|nr:peptidase S41 [Flavobacteriales bacterium]|tara:strand:- start:1322 stop:2881 length:1560 start_codon:yes stop_codon:yes gene_type:complete